MYHYKSPAKLNLFLNILEKRSDGYHNIQSVFQLINLNDLLDFEERNDDKIVFSSNVDSLCKKNSIIDSINLLKNKYNFKNKGINIYLKKNIPIGSGLGGGSSNAAITLLAVSKIWKLDLTIHELMKFGLKIGNDVPFFINGTNAWVEGRGEKIEKIKLPQKWFLLIFSKELVSTSDIYASVDPESFRPKATYNDFLSDKLENVFESIVMKRYPTIAKARNWLSQFGKVKMSGTGGTIFISFNDHESAQKVYKMIPRGMVGCIAQGIQNL